MLSFVWNLASQISFYFIIVFACIAFAPVFCWLVFTYKNMATKITKTGPTTCVRRTNSIKVAPAVANQIKKPTLPPKKITPPKKTTPPPRIGATTRSRAAAAAVLRSATAIHKPERSEVIVQDNMEILASTATVSEEMRGDTIASNEGITTLKLVAEATRFLKRISFYNVNAELKPRFKTSMFGNTVLDRNTAQEQGLIQDQQIVNNNILDNQPGPASRINQARAAPANQSKHVASLDEIFRKNLYYLASLMLNVDEILIQLVQVDVFRLAEKDLVVDPQFRGESILKALKMYEILLQKDENKFAMFKQILMQTGNEESYNLLQLPIPVAEEVEVEVDLPTLASRARVRNSMRLTENLPPGAWICNACTYINKQEHLNCDVCGKVVLEGEPLELEELNNSIHCNFCTYANEANTIACVMCGSNLVNQNILTP